MAKKADTRKRARDGGGDSGGDGDEPEAKRTSGAGGEASQSSTRVRASMPGLSPLAAELAAPPWSIEFSSQPVALAETECNLISLRDRAPELTVGDFIVSAMHKLLTVIAAEGLVASGNPVAVYYGDAPVDGCWDCEVGFPIITPRAKLAPTIVVGEVTVRTTTRLPSGRAHTALVRGHYSRLAVAWAMMRLYCQSTSAMTRARSAKQVSEIVSWEEYLTDPTIVTDSAHWLTRLVAPL